MPEAPAPTYRVDTVDGADRYVCIIPYAGMPDDVCGHWSGDFELFTQHMFQRHNGDLVIAQAVAPQVAAPPPRAGQAAASPASSAAPKE
jgi:hypothetical protein